MTKRWSGGNLTLVFASISVLHVVNLEQPIVGTFLVDCFEPTIAGVGKPPHRQQVQVTGPYP